MSIVVKTTRTNAARLMWLYALAVLLVLAPASASAGQIVESGNLLVNPGAENGALAPWESLIFSATNQPAMLPAGTIDSTEGDWWFRADVEVAITEEDAPTGTITKSPFVPMWQKAIDVRGFGTIDSLTFGADAFGVFELLGGNPQATSMDFSLLVQLFDENMQAVAGGQPDIDVFISTVRMDANPSAEIGFRDTVIIPLQPAFVRFVAQMHPTVVGTVGDGARFQLGFDDLHLSVSHRVPEPSAILLAATGVLGAVRFGLV